MLTTAGGVYPGNGLLSFSAFDGINLLHDPSVAWPYAYVPSFEVWTDANSNIVDWNFLITVPGPDDRDTIASTSSGDNVDYQYLYNWDPIEDKLYWERATASTLGGGAWQILDDVSQVPLPAALPLLMVGLGGLGFIGRRKKKAA